tara:strand:+ start:350 stop:706 length:357 start_codon:yes stop_codon:yes gene_type:complete
MDSPKSEVKSSELTILTLESSISDEVSSDGEGAEEPKSPSKSSNGSPPELSEAGACEGCETGDGAGDASAFFISPPQDGHFPHFSWNSLPHDVQTKADEDVEAGGLDAGTLLLPIPGS